MIRGTKQSCLFGLELPITSWLPDETLFSLCSRYHCITGNALARTSALQLFGHPRNGTQHDFPSRAAMFVERTQGIFGDSAQDIIREHTILRFYLPWRAPQMATCALCRLVGERPGTVKQQLGLLASGFRAHHPLKVCVQCRQDDRQRFGVSYWHLCHQYPGVWVCVKHARILNESMYKSSGAGRFLWCLPDQVELYKQAPDEATLDPIAKQHLTSLAELIIAASELRGGAHIDYPKLLQTYLRTLQARGLTRGDGQFALHAIGEHYVKFISCLRIVPELAHLPATLDQATSHVGRLLRTPRSGTHPLRHLLLILWLFGNWSTFWQAYEDKTPPRTPKVSDNGRRRQPLKARDNQHHEVIRLISEQGYSASSAAKQVGTTYDTALAWATAAGIRLPKHPRHDPQVQRRLIKDLKRGIEKADAADKYHVSIQAITRLLRSEVGLRLAWHVARHELRGHNARQRWQQAHKRYPSASIKTLRLLEPGSYAWLYRNDRNWLKEHAKGLYKPTPSNYAHTDWINRDARLSALVRQTHLRLATESPTRRITLQTIYQALPALKPMLGKLDRLPLTRQSLKAAMAQMNKAQSPTLSPHPKSK